MSSPGRVFNGKKIRRPRPGTVAGARTIGDLIDAANALCNAKICMVAGEKGNVVISDGGTIYEVPMGGTPTTTTVSGGVTMMGLISYNQDATDGDYLVCRPIGGDSGGSEDVRVAVEPQLQSWITSQTLPDSSSWAYTAYDEAAQQRTATSGGTELTEYISPPFIVGDFIPVQSCEDSGVFDGATELTRIAITGRQWASPTV